MIAPHPAGSGHRDITLSGIGISSGIAIGKAYVVQVEHPRPHPQSISTQDIGAEKQRLAESLAAVEANLIDMKNDSARLPPEMREDAASLMDTHLGMLKSSRLVRGAIQNIADNLITAECAVYEEMQHLRTEFLKIDDPYIKSRIDDIESIANRILRKLMDMPLLSLDSVPDGALVFAKDITPSEALLLDPRRFGGLATMRGGAAGHTAIMARGLGLPAVLGVQGLLEDIKNGDDAIIDAIEGLVIIAPSPGIRETYRTRLRLLEEDRARLEKISPLPAVTKDGLRIKLRANMELPRDIENVVRYNADGIGLFRTEFLYMNRDDLPSEDEQYDAIVACLKRAGSEGMTIRTLDIGGDKIARALKGHLADDANPALGLRAIRLALKYPSLLKTQYRAAIRAAVHGPVRLLLPLVTTAAEFMKARDIFDKTVTELKAEGYKLSGRPPPLGCMIEVPAAALAADSLALVADFFALGTNDLTQYTIAIDRGNDQVASLYDSLNPAVLRLIDFTFQAASRAGIPVSICGEMAADPEIVPLLLGIGIRDFSVGPGALLSVKKRLSEIDSLKARALADKVMAQSDRAVIESLIKSFNS